MASQPPDDRERAAVDASGAALLDEAEETPSVLTCNRLTHAAGAANLDGSALARRVPWPREPSPFLRAVVITNGASTDGQNLFGDPRGRPNADIKVDTRVRASRGEQRLGDLPGAVQEPTQRLRVHLARRHTEPGGKLECVAAARDTSAEKLIVELPQAPVIWAIERAKISQWRVLSPGSKRISLPGKI